MAHGQDSEIHKRKRSPDDNGNQPGHPDRIPQPPPPSGNTTPINYLSKTNATKLSLIQGDSETFSEVITLINEYEGVLNRHESLAANLGAKLFAPRLLKAMEGAFDGPIKTTPTNSYGAHPPTWLDIVKFAKSNPNELSLTTTPSGSRTCQFYLKGFQVEITEDDWRLMMSGALDRFLMVPPNAFEEDENAELATLEILEKRLQVLIKKADEVARKARQLNYHMSGRKAAISSRKSSSQSPSGGFQAVNQPQRGGPNPGYDLKADLLQQFTTASALASSSRAPPPPSSVPVTPTQSVSTTPKPSQSQLSMSSRPSPAYFQDSSQNTPSDDPSAVHRPLITSRIEKLARGDTIYPPCDRCRRLKVTCVKHLTACQGCTKKHAKCGWKGVTEEELAWLTGQRASVAPETETEESSTPGGKGTFRVPEATMHEEVRNSAGSGRKNEGRNNDRKDDSSNPNTPSDLMEVDQQKQSEPSLGISSGPVRDHSLLSHMATVATAEAEARVAASSSSQWNRPPLE